MGMEKGGLKLLKNRNIIQLPELPSQTSCYYASHSHGHLIIFCLYSTLTTPDLEHHITYLILLTLALLHSIPNDYTFNVYTQ